RPVDLMDYIKIIEDLLGITAVKDFLPMQQGDVGATYADIEKAKAKLGFEPKTHLEDGLKAFVTWYLEHPDLTRDIRAFRKNAL
ncbi:MAG: protein CapI, partial [Pseudomonadota bacterium]